VYQLGRHATVGQLNGVGGLCLPFIRREKGSARGDFQGENRVPMVHDVPSARSRSGGFLNEGSALYSLDGRPNGSPAGQESLEHALGRAELVWETQTTHSVEPPVERGKLVNYHLVAIYKKP
jgi:hypothetical protein